MENKEYTTRQEQLARFAKAMGHPARVAILEFLANISLSVFLSHPVSALHLSTLSDVEKLSLSR
mgnify:CR=1 FL=1